MIDLDDWQVLEHRDPKGMLKVLEGFPEQCERALELGREFPLPPELAEFERLAIVGMGGSGIVGDLLRRLLPLPVTVHRGYEAVATASSLEKTLIIGVSYSGNTEETLSALERLQGLAGKEAKVNVICLSSGGQLERLAEGRGWPFLKIPGGIQPRAALGYLLLPILGLLARLGRFPEGEFEGLIPALQRLSEELSPGRPTGENRAKQLARWLFGGVPLIWGVEGTTDVAAFRWKTQLNENGKQPAFWNVLPELCHNEIESLWKRELLLEQRVVFLASAHDHPRNRLRRQLMKELLEERGIPSIEVAPPAPAGGGKLAELLGLIYLGDFVSVYLGLLNGVDPTPVELIEEFKRRLKARQD